MTCPACQTKRRTGIAYDDGEGVTVFWRCQTCGYCQHMAFKDLHKQAAVSQTFPDPTRPKSI